jgi:hypothetical protein
MLLFISGKNVYNISLRIIEKALLSSLQTKCKVIRVLKISYIKEESIFLMYRLSIVEKL